MKLSIAGFFMCVSLQHSSALQVPVEHALLDSNKSANEDQHATETVNEGLPHDFKAFWPGGMPMLREASLASQKPIHVSGIRIALLGMNLKLGMHNNKSLVDLAGLCSWFDQGHCSLTMMVHEIDPSVKGELEKIVPKLNIVVDPAEESSRVLLDDTQKMARLRNRMLDIVQGMHIDIWMPIDMDGVVRLTDQTFGAITTALQPSFIERWDAVAFLAHYYYDMWALRCSIDSQNCWAVKPHTCWHADYYSCVTQAAQGSYETLTEVASAFNGLALYKMDAIGECKYDGVNHAPPARAQRRMGQDCEHVNFHRCLVQSGKKMMLSSMAIETSASGKEIDGVPCDSCE